MLWFYKIEERFFLWFLLIVVKDSGELKRGNKFEYKGEGEKRYVKWSL